jgi:hypothetical protein
LWAPACQVLWRALDDEFQISDLSFNRHARAKARSRRVRMPLAAIRLPQEGSAGRPLQGTRQLLFFGLFKLAINLLLSGCGVEAQFAKGSALFNFSVNESEEELKIQLQNLPGLQDKYFPEKFLLPRSYYEIGYPEDSSIPRPYTMNVIFDPCRYHSPDCCLDTFGMKEFLVVEPPDLATGKDERRYSLREDGELIPEEYSRLMGQDLYINEACTGQYRPFTNCVDARLAKRDASIHPSCFNYNATIESNKKCRAPSDSTPLDFCVEIAITQTAHILECGGPYEADEHCGTWLEIHRPGRKEILSSTRLKSIFTSGYRMSLLSLTYKREDNHVLCYDRIKNGDYEVWWVQRTLDRWRVERRIPFRVVSPQCDWDPNNNRYQPFATIGQSRTLVGLETFAEERFLYARPRREGSATGRPGRGMGSLYIPRQADTFPPDARFIYDNDYSYRFTPQADEYTVKAGVIEPPNKPRDEI